MGWWKRGLRVVRDDCVSVFFSKTKKRGMVRSYKTLEFCLNNWLHMEERPSASACAES